MCERNTETFLSVSATKGGCKSAFCLDAFPLRRELYQVCFVRVSILDPSSSGFLR